MKGILRDLLFIGHPKEKPEQQWQEIMLARHKVAELERRLRCCDQQHRPLLRYRVLVAAREPQAVTPEEGGP
jgi:hypothetical protein